MATKLEKLFIGEVSGVDDPANEIRGWMVCKSRGADGLVARTREDGTVFVAAGGMVKAFYVNGTTEIFKAADLDILSRVAKDADAHQSHSQMRHLTGQFRQSVWQDRTPRPRKLGPGLF